MVGEFLLPASWTNSGSRASRLSSWTESASQTETFRTSTAWVSVNCEVFHYGSMPTILVQSRGIQWRYFTLIETKYQPANIHLFLILQNSELLMQKQINQNKFPTDNVEPNRAGPQENLSVKKHQ